MEKDERNKMGGVVQHMVDNVLFIGQVEEEREKCDVMHQ